MALFGTKVNGVWMSWKQVRRYIHQQEAEFAVLKQASEEEISKLKVTHEESTRRLRHELGVDKSTIATLNSKVERLQSEAAAADKRIQEQDVVTRNLADENSALREKNRDLRARINTLSGQNAKMKKLIDALPQRGENGRFVKKKADAPELKPNSVEAKHKVTDK